jgi:hypothetical protein
MSLQATHDHEDSVEVDGKTAIVQRKAGEKWLMKGEATIIPSIYQKVVIKPSPAIAIEQNEGIYILNLCTQEVRLVEGPRSIFLDVDEELWTKDLSEVERDTLFADKKSMHYLEHYNNYLGMFGSSSFLFRFFSISGGGELLCCANQ